MLRDLIRDGHDHARTKRHLATAAYGCTCRSDTCTHKRDVEEEIRRLVIEEHQWIVADGRGYWRTDDPAEVERYIHSLEGRRDSLTERAQALRAAVAARKADVTQTSWLDAA
jgi:hypothetical protein